MEKPCFTKSPNGPFNPLRSEEAQETRTLCICFHLKRFQGKNGERWAPICGVVTPGKPI